jgi:hypothetical protein
MIVPHDEVHEFECGSGNLWKSECGIQSLCGAIGFLVVWCMVVWWAGGWWMAVGELKILNFKFQI